jgi:simple sugar transport system ATP-binding protein
MTVAPVLSLAGITKRFGETIALQSASIRVRSGAVHALLGENGAGKTTLMRVAYGLLAPDDGIIEVDGHPRHAFRSPADAIAAGLGMVHQHFTLVPPMTVAENVALGEAGRFDARAVSDRLTAIAASTGLALDPNARVATLGLSAQQRLEIVKALARGARCLILDEPTAVLAPAEARELLRWSRQFADSGRAVVLITHKLAEALSVADDVTVLRRGRTVLALPRPDVDSDALVNAMIGDRLTDVTPVTRSIEASGPVVIGARRLCLLGDRGEVHISDASFDIRQGEIVGVAAVDASGHHQLMLALAGRYRRTSGELRLPESIGYVPADRHGEALVLDMELRENVLLRGAAKRRGLIDWGSAASHTRELMERFDVRASSASARASVLSGGNQQRLVLARELDGPPVALVAEHPTRGLDIRATAFVHSQLRSAKALGVAVVIHSTDLDELVALADRVLVVFSGQVREVPVDSDTIGRAMLGVT